MTLAHNRIEVMHGVNLDQLGRRDPAVYGTLTLTELERRVEQRAEALGLRTTFFHSNHEGEFVERLHALREEADAILLNPGAWTHYAWSIHDALDSLNIPLVEVHLSNPDEREDWRKVSVIRDVVSARFVGQGADGYRLGLEYLKENA